MKKLIMVVFLATIVALPPWVQGAQGSQVAAQENEDKDKKEKKEKTVPEPGTILLVGAAGVGLWGARQLLRSKRR
jgi:hypothetical protein